MLPIRYYFYYVVSLLTKHFVSKKKKELNQKLFWSIRNKQYDEMKELIFQGADINTVFHPIVSFRESALTMVAVWGDLELIKFLVDRGADIDFNNGIALKNSSDLAQFEVTQYLIEEGADFTLNDGDVIRRIAVAKEFDILKLMLDHPKHTEYVLKKVSKIQDKSVIEWANHYSKARQLYEKLNTKLETSVQKIKPVKI